MCLRGGEKSAWHRSESALGDIVGADQILLVVFSRTNRAVSFRHQLGCPLRCLLHRRILGGVFRRPLEIMSN